MRRAARSESVAADDEPLARPGTLVFCHANGYPAGTYRLLLEVWRDAGWRVLAVDRLGHDPDYPVSSNWPRLRDEVVAFVEREAPGGKVHLVGHSLGGYLGLLVACRRPDLVAGLVMIDSPVVTGWRAHSLQVAKVSGLVRRFSPARLSVRRRWQWPSVEAAWEHFAAKTMFARWHPEVLRDYIAWGTEPDPEGGSADAVRLAFRREIETRIYNTVPHTLGPLLRRHPPRCPVSFIGGTRSAEIRQVGLAATRALVGERLSWIEGTHLFPMEKPRETAQAVLAALR